MQVVQIFTTLLLAAFIGYIGAWYTGAGEFIHASTSKGVIRSRLDNVYWNSRYWQARRLTQ